jgi:Putative transposase
VSSSAADGATIRAGFTLASVSTAWRDGAKHHVMSPLEFMQRLAALVPRPRLHLIRFGGCITSLREISVPPPLRARRLVAQNGTECEVALQGSAASGKRTQGIARNRLPRAARVWPTDAPGLGKIIKAGIQLRPDSSPALWR